MNLYFIDEIERNLPLHIQRASYESDQFNIGDDSWSFNANSAWRIISSQGLEFGWESDFSNTELNSLIGTSVVKVNPLGMGNLDPQFILSDGRAIEIFSAQHLEPWVLHLPNQVIIVSDAQSA